MAATAPVASFAPSANVAQMKESATIAVSARARSLRAAGRTVLDLGAGEPDFPTPRFICEAAERAIEAGETKYTATEGILQLRQAVAVAANELYRGPDSITPADVVVSTGSKQSIFNAAFVLFGEGDEVLVPTPAWTSYYEIVALARAKAVPVVGDVSRSLKVSAAQLAAAATQHTKGLILNSPCNPTGAVYTEQELRAITSLAAERGWWLISDEIYHRIAYDRVAASVLDVIGERDHVVYINGVAKAYSMTGWRIGWAVAPRVVAQTMTALQSHTTSNPSTVSQYAALAALTDLAGAERAIATMVAQFHARRDAAMALLDQAHVQYVRPEGAFYLYINVGRDGAAFATELLDQHGVAVVPGAAFLTPTWIRASYAATMETVVEGVRRIVALLNARR